MEPEFQELKCLKLRFKSQGTVKDSHKRDNNRDPKSQAKERREEGRTSGMRVRREEKGKAGGGKGREGSDRIDG